MSRSGSEGGADSRCPRCRTPVHRQWVGIVAALYVVADLTPLTPAEQTAVREPNRLIWCLRSTPHTTRRLTWAGRDHPAGCPHPHVTEHRCPPAEPTTLF
ncbi:hypothetical protein LG634_24830 [Streptomyces bambusae]|uniref:hypothetical protein n=1 Tax=Streptomyces bambusae TaxID=1550616 RepID=UPI001CFD5AB5|nr:hypothetical protein [Streptomyces bambusae]MCB5168039.1 hypothetical protein [Streptomyces bambusae]